MTNLPWATMLNACIAVKRELKAMQAFWFGVDLPEYFFARPIYRYDLLYFIRQLFVAFKLSPNQIHL